MDRDKLQELSLFTVDIYNEIEGEIFRQIGEALSRGTAWAERKPGMVWPDEDIVHWKLLKMQQIGRLEQQHIQTIAKYARMTEQEVKKLIRTVGMEEAAVINDTLKGLVPAAAVAPVAESAVIAGVLSIYERQAINIFNYTNTVMLQGAKMVYQDILNTATAKVLTGVKTAQQAVREVASSWAEKGIPVLEKSNGDRLSLEAYVNMNIRTTSNNVANAMQDARMDEYDIDLIEISSHLGARPKCEPFQGRIFSRSGRSKKYPAFSTTSYGDPAGLFGVNCGHVKYPYVEGKSKQTFTPYDKAKNDKAYKESQKQRELERGIRRAKKRLNMMNALKDEEGIKGAKALVNRRHASMREFLDKTGRKRQRNREQIVT